MASTPSSSSASSTTSSKRDNHFFPYFLKPEHIKDKAGRRPDHPEYDQTTLWVPDYVLAPP